MSVNQPRFKLRELGVTADQVEAMSEEERGTISFGGKDFHYDDDYKAVFFVIDEERHRKLYDIVCKSGVKKVWLVLPLSNESRCEGPAIGGNRVSGRDAWKSWSHDAYSDLKEKGVTWRVEDGAGGETSDGVRATPTDNLSPDEVAQWMRARGAQAMGIAHAFGA